MTTSLPADPSRPSGSTARLSVPPKFVAPRPLTAAEVTTLRAIADVLIPAAGDDPAATAEADFDRWLARAVDARADAFDAITAVAAQFEGATPEAIDEALRTLYAGQPDVFQVVSAVVAGAWLMIPAVRERIGYPGQGGARARLEEAAEQISDGILDPVLARGPVYTPAD
jgi:hypothetical protein